MKKFRILLIIFFIGALVLLAKPATPSECTVETSLSILRCNYFDLPAFKASFDEMDNRSGLCNQEGDSAVEKSQVNGGILPHHLVAAPMIARFFTVIKESVSPETIIILAPNHNRVGDRPLHTGAFTWNTPFGQLKADVELVEDLIKTFGAGVNPSLLEEEHSIAALIPYIHYTFPKTKIVPILIHGNMDSRNCTDLSEFLAKAANEKSCLILASIDFSHGLQPVDALKHDEITQIVIKDRDYETLSRLDNTYLDAPPTLCTFLMTIDKMEAKVNDHIQKDPERGDSEYGIGDILEHGEASQFLKRHVPETTSYMTYIFD